MSGAASRTTTWSSKPKRSSIAGAAGCLRRLMQDVIPLINVAWITPELHARAVESHLADLRRLGEALALGRHFREAGFAVKP